MISQRSGIQTNNMIEDDKRKGIDEVMRQNERIDENLKSQV